MNRAAGIRAVGLVALLLCATTANGESHGLLRIAWQACPGYPGASSQATFSCDPASGDICTLYGTYSLNAAVGTNALDAILDFRFEDSDVPPFWQFQSGGCNEPGVRVLDAKPTDGRCGTSLEVRTDLCGSSGISCVTLITGYGAGSHLGPNRSRLFISAVNYQASPRVLQPLPAAQLAFRLQFLMDRASGAGGDGCAGCEARAAVTWNQLVIYEAGSGAPLPIDSDDPGSEPSAWVHCTGCASVSSSKGTWGRLKAHYR